MNRRLFLGSASFLAAAPSVGARTSGDDRVQEMRTQIETLPVFDTHEHLEPESQRVSSHHDFFTLASHYAMNDVISAGLPPEGRRIVEDPDAPLAQRWAAFVPYWRHARFTGYGEALRLAIREVYGIDEISASALPRINDAIAAKNKPGLYREILRERAGIEHAVLDDYWNAAPVKPEDPFFLPARKFDRYVTPQSPRQVRRLEELTGVSITSLEGLKLAMEKSFEQSLAVGMVALKSTMAYVRVLRFHEVSVEDAARDFERMMKGAEPLPAGFRGHTVRPFRKLEDHMFHHLVRLAAEHRRPFQIHTGLLAGNGNFIENTKPTGLTNLFFLYPGVKFDLFHTSYPYLGELATLAKVFPNVHIDFCWTHIISPSAARRALGEYLETVPVNKIFGFGGDYRYPELTYAHLIMARRNIAAVLAERTAAGWCSEDEALAIARELLHDAPARVFSPG